MPNLLLSLANNFVTWVTSPVRVALRPATRMTLNCNRLPCACVPLPGMLAKKNSGSAERPPARDTRPSELTRRTRPDLLKLPTTGVTSAVEVHEMHHPLSLVSEFDGWSKTRTLGMPQNSLWWCVAQHHPGILCPLQGGGRSFVFGVKGCIGSAFFMFVVQPVEG